LSSVECRPEPRGSSKDEEIGDQGGFCALTSVWRGGKRRGNGSTMVFGANCRDADGENGGCHSVGGDDE
jgi:hypothetical protein